MGLSSQLHEGLTQIAAGVEGATVRGRGLLAGVYYPNPETAERLRLNPLPGVCSWKRPNPEGEVVKTMPALTISPEDLQKGLDILAAAAVTVTGEPVALGSTI